MSIPLLMRCKQIWPDHQLVLVCRQGLGDFFLKTKIVDQVFEIKKGQQDSYENILTQLQTQKIDFLISPHQSVRTGLFCRKIKAKHKISFHNWWNFFVFSDRIHRNDKLPDALRQLSLLGSSLVPQFQDVQKNLENYLVQEKPFMTNEKNKLSPPPSWGMMSLRNQVLGQLDIYQKLSAKFQLKGFEEGKAVLIFPGSVWATKRWTEEGFIGVGQALQSQGYCIYVMGGPGEEMLAEKVASQIPGSISLAGQTSIFESAQLIARAALVLGNDSASTHLASVCETPLIAVFGPTILDFGYRPWSAQSYVVERKGLDCRPCGKHGHRVCPKKNHECMTSITADQVLKPAQFILKR